MSGTARRAAWAFGELAGLLVLAIGIGEILGWPFLRAPLNAAMTREAEVPVTMAGRFRLQLIGWPIGRPRVSIERLTVGAAEELDLELLVAAENVDLAWRWRDLWRWRDDAPLRIALLAADSVDANLVRLDDGRASWHLGARTAPAPGHTASGELPRFGSLRIGQGRVQLADAPLKTRLQIVIESNESNWDADVAGHYRALPLELKVHAEGALALLRDEEDGVEAPRVPLRVEGSLGASHMRFDGQAAALLGARLLQGKLQLRGPSLAQIGKPLGVTLPNTPPFDIDAELSHESGTWRARIDKGVVGGSRLGGEYVFDARREPPLLSGEFTGERLAFADLGPAVGASDKRQDEPESQRGRVLPQRRFDLPALRAMDADLQVAIDTLAFGSDTVEPLRKVRTHLTVDKGVLRLDEFRAHAAGGTFSGHSALDGNADAARWELVIDFQLPEVSNWISALKPSGENMPAYLSGALDGRVEARGHGRSTGEILGGLVGEGHLALRDAEVSHLATEALGLDAAQAIGLFVIGDAALPLRCANVAWIAEDGIVQILRAVLDNADSTVRAAGRVDLRDESLAVRAVARPKDFSPFSLRAPITVRGSLASPTVGIEGGKLAAKAVGAAALAAAAGPFAALLPFLEAPDREGGDPCKS